MIEGREFPPDWLYQYKDELNRYANTLGYSTTVEKSISAANSFSKFPASNVYGLTRHHKNLATVRLYWLKND